MIGEIILFDKIEDDFLKKTLKNEDIVEFARDNVKLFQELMSRYRCAIMEVETKFKVLNEEFSLQYDRNPIETIKSRLKTPEGILKKMQRKEIPFSVEAIEENIRDVAGVRVICSFPEDVYILAKCFLTQDDIHLLEMKDYIKKPKQNGYRSLHMIVEVPIFLRNEKRVMKVEVQLRTVAMDCWASLEHKMRYKKDFSSDIAEEITRELTECALISADLDHRMEKIKNKILT